jgi:hypothetical protein
MVENSLFHDESLIEAKMSKPRHPIVKVATTCPLFHGYVLPPQVKPIMREAKDPDIRRIQM